MTIHVLIVEDDDNFVEEIHKMLDLLPENSKRTSHVAATKRLP